MVLTEYILTIKIIIEEIFRYSSITKIIYIAKYFENIFKTYCLHIYYKFNICTEYRNPHNNH